MDPTHFSTEVPNPAPVVTTIATGSTSTTDTTIAPMVRTAEARTSLLELPNEILFQILVHLSESGYANFFPALSHLLGVSRRAAEVLKEGTLWIHRMRKPSAKDSAWWWGKLQTFVNQQVDAGSDRDTAISAGLDRLLKPGMHLVPCAGKMLEDILSVKHAGLACSTITFDIPKIASQSTRPSFSSRSVDPWDYIASVKAFELSQQETLCKSVNRFLLQNVQMKERPQIFVTWNWDAVGKYDTLSALAYAAAEYGNAFLTLKSGDEPTRESAALIEALKSGSVISIDLNVRSMKDKVAKELIQAIRKANSVQHLMICYFAKPSNDDNASWADLLPELNGHESLRKLTVFHWGAAEATRDHLQNLPDCPNLETVEFRLCVYEDKYVADESTKMQELVDAVRPAGKDKFSVMFVVGAKYPVNA